ncbi:MAG: RNA-directed DNA polymerase [Chloroflexi bacterium]|nr:RNA-directed DNA polymerase [Chloroflexota bacterium]
MQNNTQSDYERFLSLGNFCLAWRQLRNSFRIEVKDRDALEVYATNIEKYLESLISDVDSGRFQPSMASYYYAVKGDLSLRPIAWLHFRDRIVYQAISNIIIKNSRPFFAKYTQSTFANVPAYDSNGDISDFVLKPFKTIHYPQKWIGQYDKFIRAKQRGIDTAKTVFADPWLVELDIANYYHTIDHELLLKTLGSHERGWLPDERLQLLLVRLLSRWSTDLGRGGRGIPVGYEASDILGTLFLAPLDAILSAQKDAQYIRYVDDFAILADGLHNARGVFAQTDWELQQLGLVRNSSKTRFIHCEDARPKDDHLSMLELLTENDEQSHNSNSESQAALREQIETIIASLPKDFATFSQRNLVLVSPSDAKEIAFVLYRLTLTDTKYLNLALGVLETFPRYSFHAATYLGRYIAAAETSLENADLVIERLFAFAESDNTFSQVKIDSAYALTIGLSNRRMQWIDRLSQLLLDWCSGNDWYKAFRSIELLAGDDLVDEPTAFIDVALNNPNPFVQIRALNVAFEKSQGRHERLAILDHALRGDEYHQLLALHLWRKHADIQRNEVSLLRLAPELESLIVTIDEHRAAQDLATRLHNDGKPLVEYSAQLRLALIFPDLVRASQLVIDMFSPSVTVRTMIDAAYEFIGLVFSGQAILNPDCRNVTSELAQLIDCIDDVEVRDDMRLLIGYKSSSSVRPQERSNVERLVRRLSKTGFEWHSLSRGIEAISSHNVILSVNRSLKTDPAHQDQLLPLQAEILKSSYLMPKRTGGMLPRWLRHCRHIQDNTILRSGLT